MNEYIKSEISKKGFCVYNYISLNELFLTVKKDYLSILTKINTFFGITSVFIFALNPLFGLLFLFFGFGIIFFILFIKLLYRSYYFLLISDIIFTKKGLILGKQIIENDYDYTKKISKYENLFSENLGGYSKLNDIIIEKRFLLFKSSKKGGEKVLSLLKNINSKESGGLIFFAIIGIGIYSFFLYIFYYIGYILGIIFFGIFAIFLKIILHFTKNKELEIKETTQEIDINFKKLNEIYINLNEKINNFTSGEISNLGDFVEKNFKIFYSNILLSLKNKNKLFDTLQNYKHKDFIDFELLEKYIKTNFNKPINDMIFLLEDTENKLKNQINEIINLKNTSKEFAPNLKQKEIILNHQLDLIISNKLKFKNSLI